MTMTIDDLARLIEEKMPGNRGRLAEAAIAEKLGVVKCSPRTLVHFIETCAERGLLVTPLYRGGFGIIRASTLEGAPPFHLDNAKKDFSS